jgi:hypothetical protein
MLPNEYRFICPAFTIKFQENPYTMSHKVVFQYSNRVNSAAGINGTLFESVEYG